MIRKFKNTITILLLLMLLLIAVFSVGVYAEETLVSDQETEDVTEPEPAAEPEQRTEPVSEPETTYVVSFYVDDREVDSMEIVEGGSIEVIPDTPEKENAVFRGWYTEQGSAFKTGTVVKEDLIYYARFNEQALVVFLIDEEVYERQHFELNGTPFHPEEPADPVKEGAVFEGWFKDAAFTDRVDFSQEYLTESIWYYAKFTNEAELMWTVKFFVDGSVYQEKNYEKDGKLRTIEAPEKPKKEGYLFSGWYQDEAYQAKASFPAKLSDDASYYGSFVTEGKVYFRLDGQAYKEQSFPLDGKSHKIKEPETPEKEGFVFDGWYEDAGFTKRLNFPMKVNTNAIIYGKFTREGYVRFYTGAELYAEQSFLTSEIPYQVKIPDDPFQEGFVFDGWYTDEALQNKAVFPMEVNRNAAFYAGFSEVEQPQEENTKETMSFVAIIAIAEGVVIVVLVVLFLLKGSRKQTQEQSVKNKEQ